MEGSNMKKTYETLEAHKICFNANEQIAAAACVSYVIDGKYGNEFGPTCEVDIVDGNYVNQAGENLSTPDYEAYWGTPGAANDKVRYA